MSKFNIDLNTGNIFFIGVGGVSMSALAEFLHIKGYNVSGSDERASASTERLLNAGVMVKIGHCADNITDDIKLVVYTAAVKEDNPEIIAARNMGITIINRAELLGYIISNYKFSIGVSGMHGKTTTTSMITDILLKHDPTVFLGGFYKPINGNFHIGSSDLFIFEACEYCDSFLQFYPSVGLILNIEEDHLDYFKDITHIRRSFRSYAENVRDILIINSQIENLNEIIDGLSCKVITFGQNGNYHAENITYGASGESSFDIFKNGDFIASIKSKLIGRHNVENALAAFTVCNSLGLTISYNDIASSLSTFLPADRRFQFKGNYNGAVIIDDYAHHPTEIKMALAGAKNTNCKKIICLFQPHTYTRTEALFNDFTQAFNDADEAAFIDIYAAREKDTGKVSSKLLSEAVGKAGKKSLYFSSFSEAANYYCQNLSEGDMLITMGAGDVYLVGEKILSGGTKDGVNA